MQIPIEFSMYREQTETVYQAHIKVGRREYRATITGENALETIADDILRLTVVAQVQAPTYFVQIQDDTAINPETDKAAETLMGLLHDNDRIIKAHNHVRERTRVYQIRILNAPSFPEYH